MFAAREVDAMMWAESGGPGRAPGDHAAVLSGEGSAPELWALDRIEEIAAPYHDWLAEDEPVLNDGFDLRAGSTGICITRDGSPIGQLRGEAWSVELAERLGHVRSATAATLSDQLGVPFTWLADALRELERAGVIQTALAARCAGRNVDDA